MEYQKIKNLLDNNIPDKVPRFIQSGETYNTNNQTRFKTTMLR